MIMNNMDIFCFICIVLVTLQTSHSARLVQQNCPKYDPNKSCDKNEVRFYLRTERDGNIHTQELFAAEDSDTIEKAGFLEGRPLKFIVHGHNEDKDDFLVTPLQEEYFKLNYNVVVINYAPLSHDDKDKLCYRTGVENSFPISECAAKLIEAIIKKNRKNITIQDFHLIGLSLGGQIVGQIPHDIDISYGTFPRITGIDPAGEGFFEDYGVDQYILTANDALLVDVVHSNAGINGRFQPMGHIDWYPNGGTFQPECPPGNYLCDHMSSLIYYLESIGDPNFKIDAQWCPNLETMALKPQECDNFAKVRFGEYVNIDVAEKTIKNGVYFFKTNENPPYIREGAHKYEVHDVHLLPPEKIITTVSS